MIFPVVALATSAGLAALDGWAASSDSNAGRTSLTQERANWVKAAGFIAGVGLDFAGWNEEVTESLMGTSLALFARQLAFRAGQSGRATPVAAQGYAAYVPSGAAHGYANAPGAGVVSYEQPISVAG